MDEFMEGMERGVQQTTAHMMTPAQREKARVDALPYPPAANLQAPGMIFRCTNGKTTSDYKITATDWLISGPGRYQWRSRHCNVGEHKTAMGGSSKTTCGLRYNPWSITISTHWFGSSYVEESIDEYKKTNRIKSNLGKGTQVLNGTCKVIKE
ncbi:hypothetical protein C7C56_019160 [Massilia glaciei]|uniref:Uncharacterized protein n=2 Tax=Massilia glaciei TaxID=1524097 RepID=A0A2U2HGT4_9BURK|nr:hypothetical protein C7C56_019160 [Massilia glaciei]